MTYTVLSDSRYMIFIKHRVIEVTERLSYLNNNPHSMNTVWVEIWAPWQSVYRAFYMSGLSNVHIIYKHLYIVYLPRSKYQQSVKTKIFIVYPGLKYIYSIMKTFCFCHTLNFLEKFKIPVFCQSSPSNIEGRDQRNIEGKFETENLGCNFEMVIILKWL